VEAIRALSRHRRRLSHVKARRRRTACMSLWHYMSRHGVQALQASSPEGTGNGEVTNEREMSAASFHMPQTNELRLMDKKIGTIPAGSTLDRGRQIYIGRSADLPLKLVR